MKRLSMSNAAREDAGSPWKSPQTDPTNPYRQEWADFSGAREHAAWPTGDAGGGPARTPPPAGGTTRDLGDVRRAEAEEVARRRKVHEPDKPHSAETVRQDLVGLALSGGGVRSASFNLGLLQALFRLGLLKHFDYLSSVSGGGYIASYLASLTQRKDEVQEMRRQLLPCPGQPERVVRFVRHGKYLNRPESFTNLYLIGLIFNNLAIFSGLAFLCMVVAWTWRGLDSNGLGGWIYLNLWPKKLWTELWRPFLPAAVLLSLWLLCWVGVFVWSLWKGRRPGTRLTGPLLVLGGAAFLVGVAVVLATPVISVPDVGPDERPNASPDQGVVEVTGRQHVVAGSIITLILTALTPFLRPERLLQSGIHPKSIWERRIFLVATSALFAGVPFILIWWFAHHDFAGTDKETRDRQILMGDINYRRWNEFWERVRRERDRPSSPGHFIWDKVSQDDPELVDALQNKDRREALGVLPVPIEPDDRDLKQKIIDKINAMVIGAEKDAVTGKPLAPDCYESDFARTVVCDYWGKEFTHEQTPTGAVAADEASALKGGKECTHEQKPTEWRTFLDGKIRHHGEWPRVQALVDRLEHHRLTHEEKKELNRLMLEVLYPEEIGPRGKVYRQNVIDVDQKRRLWWVLGLGAVFLVSGCVSLNATSLHSFYRDRLADAFIEPIKNDDRTIRLSGLDTTGHGAPYNLFSATLNRRPRDRQPPMVTRRDAASDRPRTPEETQPGATSAARPEHPGETATETFLLSRHYCGSASLDFRATSEYEGGRLELDDAMAISGAAFSPVQTSNPLIGFLMTIFNMRLGQWLPDPARTSRRWRLLWWGPCVHELWWDWICDRARDWLGDWLPSPGRPRWYFVTDGGHHENLGLWPLLDRRCRLIVVSDASQDGDAGFADLLRVLRRARFERGIRITGVEPPASFRGAEDEDEIACLLALLRPAPLPPSGEGAVKAAAKAEPPAPRRSRRHFFLAGVEYPAAAEGGRGEVCKGYLIYLKPTLTGDESVELQGYAALNADFPHNPTFEQLYDEDRFESYRQLGEHIGGRLCAAIAGPKGKEGELWKYPLDTQHLQTGFEQLMPAQHEALLALRAGHERGGPDPAGIDGATPAAPVPRKG